MQFRDLAAAFRRIQANNSRDTSITELAAILRRIRATSPGQLPRAMYLATSQLQYKGFIVTSWPQRMLVSSSVSVTNPSTKHVNQDEVFALYKQTGDYGTAVDELVAAATIDLHESSAPPMTIDTVFECSPAASPHSNAFPRQLELISQQVGKGSTTRKQEIAVAVLQQCRTVDEAAFLVRLLAHQNLRIGVGVKTALAALGIAYLPDGDEEAKTWLAAVATAYSQRPIFEDLVALIDGCASDEVEAMAACLLARATPKPGTPIQTMLGYPSPSLEEIVTRMAKLGVPRAACEFKYDGARLQIHVSDDGSLSIFSRNMERIPDDHKYFEAIARHMSLRPGVSSVIVEGEMVAMDKSSGKLLPFQTLQTKEEDGMCFFAFDCLLRNGHSLLQEPMEVRRQHLHDAIVPVAGDVEFVVARDIDMTTAAAPTALREVLEEAIAADCEGLMVKSLGEAYKAGARTHTWLKVKGDYLATDATTGGSGIFLPDSVDLVPIAAYRGKGRRANVFGSFLLACFNPATNAYETVGKVGSGFKDTELEEISARWAALALDTKPAEYVASDLPSVQPDVWVPPGEVWEIRAAQLTRSSRYLAGVGGLGGGKGLGVRFPRFLRLRPDKGPTEATSSDQLVELYKESTHES
ncbi:DNA ligase [Achlya hypogyna]|uniref:DNA ligase 1 n=1 Tax=Achlya hypogyna TaxID=1202772 RepID=A0A1V9ZF34_ACHHY|nr:DNA ligase [Achlya hypogyna]